MKRIAILQSNYIPWKGYFDIINMVDEFIIYDEVQFTKNDWRNRNRIKTPSAVQWLTIPVEQTGHLDRKIKEIKTVNKLWAQKHWKTLQINYAKAPFFRQYKDRLAELYGKAEKLELLSEINLLFIKEIAAILGIDTKISDSTEYCMEGDKVERLVNLCRQSGATEYISGPAAKDYIDQSLFEEAGINLSWMDYTGYPEYQQLFPPFEHAVTVMDLILNQGEDSRKYMKSFHK